MKLSRIVLALAFVASPGVAAEIVFQTSGQVTSISALQDSSPTAVPTGTISVGDAYTLSAVFDLDKAILSPTFDADPTVNIYYLPGATVTLKVGSYSTTFTPIFDFNSSAQLWNDRVVVSPTDAQSLRFFRFQAPPSEIPFEMGPGSVSYATDFFAFDSTAQARTNDLITQFVPFDQFGSQSFGLGFLNSDSKLFVNINGSVTSTSFMAAAVPEPSSWLMMILGIGAIGASMRKTRWLGDASKSNRHMLPQ